MKLIFGHIFLSSLFIKRCVVSFSHYILFRIKFTNQVYDFNFKLRVHWHRNDMHKFMLVFLSVNGFDQ